MKHNIILFQVVLMCVLNTNKQFKFNTCLGRIMATICYQDAGQGPLGPPEV